MPHSTPSDVLLNLVERAFWSQVDQAGPCWIWMGSKINSGYGYTHLFEQRWLVHRLSWVMHRGPIPGGLLVCHNCPGGDNPACLNPEHLWLGTHQQNSDDKISKGRDNARRSALRFLHDDQVREIRIRFALGSPQVSAVAKEFAVPSSTIRRIVRRESYRDIL